MRKLIRTINVVEISQGALPRALGGVEEVGCLSSMAVHEIVYALERMEGEIVLPESKFLAPLP